MSAPQPVDCQEALAVTAGLFDATDETRRRARVHLATCLRCQITRDDPEAERRFSAVPARRRVVAIRIALAALASVQLLMAVPWLLGYAGLTTFAATSVSSDHLTRDGALGLALAGMGLAAAWRPRWCPPFTVVSAALLVVQLSVGAADEQAGKVGAHFELTHLLGLLIFVALEVGWVLARERTPSVRRERPLRVEGSKRR